MRRRINIYCKDLICHSYGRDAIHRVRSKIQRKVTRIFELYTNEYLFVWDRVFLQEYACVVPQYENSNLRSITQRTYGSSFCEPMVHCLMNICYFIV